MIRLVDGLIKETICGIEYDFKTENQIIIELLKRIEENTRK